MRCGSFHERLLLIVAVLTRAFAENGLTATFYQPSPRVAESAPSSMQPDGAAPSGEITALLRDWQSGDREALDRLIPLVYRELHLMAARLMSREWRAHTIQTTGLINEAYLKLVDQR